MPKGKVMIHATLDPDHLNKDLAAISAWWAMRR